MRIGWISPSPLLPTGIGKVSHYLITGLVKKGYEVFVANPQYGGRPIAIDGATHYPLFDDFSLFQGFLNEVKPDVLIAYGSNWFPPYSQISSICAQNEVKLLYYVATEFSSLSITYLQSLVGASKVAIMSQHGQKLLAGHRINAKYIPHGVDTSIYRPMNPKPHFETAEDKFVFGMVARNSLRKEYPILLKAFSLLPEGVKNQCCLYLHTMPFEETGGRSGWNLPEMILAMGLQGKVLMPSSKAAKWWGYSEEEMAQTYNVLGCHILLSSGEGFGLPILESMACSIPQIGSNNTAIPEVIGSGGLLAECWEDDVYTAEGLTISTTKVKSARDLMLKMVEDNKLRKELSRKALEHSHEFTWERAQSLMSDAIEETYETRDRLDNSILTFDKPIEASGFSEYRARYIPVGSGKVLDLGCGPEYPYKSHFEEKGYEYIGVDIKGDGKTILPLDITKPLPFEEKEFAFLWCCHVLEHIPTEKQLAVLSEARRVARHGVVIVPLESDLAFWLDPTHNKVNSQVKEMGEYFEDEGNGVVKW